MLEEGLFLIAAGITYVFAVMTLIIFLTLAIKKVSKTPSPETTEASKEEVKPVKEEELSGEDEAIVAAITAYLTKPRVVEGISRGEVWVKSNLWSLAGRMELMSPSPWREEKWGAGLRLPSEKKRL